MTDRVREKGRGWLSSFTVFWSLIGSLVMGFWVCDVGQRVQGVMRGLARKVWDGGGGAI